MLPYFKKVERDMDFDGPWHGKEGRIPVRRIFPDLWNGHAKAVAEAFEAAGFHYIQDQNGEFKDGYFPITISNLYDRRVSAAIGYLDTGTRLRQQPDDLGRRPRSRSCCSRARAASASRRWSTARRPSSAARRSHRLVGRDPFAGASAARRHRPGRRTCAISASRSRAHVPGVGQRLMDHPSVSVSSFIKPEARLNGLTRRHILLALRYSSGIGGAPAGDMFVAGVSKSAWHAVGEQIGSLLAAVYKTFSETGQVRLASRDWRAEPIVEFNLLVRPARPRTADGRASGGSARCRCSAALREATSDPFPASYTERVRKIGVVNPKNQRDHRCDRQAARRPGLAAPHG